MFVYAKMGSSYPDAPQVYGPRWERLVDAPEVIRHLLVEVEALPENAIDLLLDEVMIEACVGKIYDPIPTEVDVKDHVGEHYGFYMRVLATKETFWDEIRKSIAKIYVEDVLQEGNTEEVPVFSKVNITKVQGNGWTWKFGPEGVPIDPHGRPRIQANMLSLDDGGDLGLAVLVMIMLCDFKAWFRCPTQDAPCVLSGGGHHVRLRRREA